MAGARLRPDGRKRQDSFSVEIGIPISEILGCAAVGLLENMRISDADNIFVLAGNLWTCPPGTAAPASRLMPHGGTPPLPGKSRYLPLRLAFSQPPSRRGTRIAPLQSQQG